MNPPIEAETIELEVIPPAEAKLVKYAGETGLEKQSTQTLVESFRPIFAKLRTALDDAKGVAASVKDATCVREIARSRACRLALRKIRLEGDETRKKEKQHALLYGRAVDGFFHILMADLSPVETALQEAEDIAERAEAKRLADLKAAREAELVPLLDEPLLGNLADLSEADYMKKLSNARFLRQAKLDAAAKAESERKAKEEADRIERERIAAENEKLKTEAIAREAAAKAERETAEKNLAEERAAAEAKARAERERLIAEHTKEATRLAAIAASERMKMMKEAEAEMTKAKAESDRLVEIARKERAEIEAKAKKDADAAAKAQAELHKKLQAESAEAVGVENERKAAVAAAKKAASAADGVKLKRFADELRALPKPSLKDASVQSDLATRIEKVAAWSETIAREELL